MHGAKALDVGGLGSHVTDIEGDPEGDPEDGRHICQDMDKDIWISQRLTEFG